MSRVSSANNYAASHPFGTSAALNTKCLIGRERHNNVHDVLVPNQNWKIYRSAWNTNELRRIKTASRVVTKEENLRHAVKFEADRKRLEWESEQRKVFLREIDRARESQLTKKLDEQNDTDKALDRVFLAKYEDIEEVKRANRIILAAKCHVVRDAQINEKMELSREQREEELRLEKMMLSECEKALAEEKRNKNEMKMLNQQYASELQQQLRNREQNKMLEAKRVEREAMVFSKAKVLLINDHLAKQRAKQEKINRIRDEFKKSSEMSNFFKDLAYEEQRIAEMKAQEYMRMKREREMQLENNKLLERERKQRETDRLLTLQTKLLQMKNDKDSMTMRRIQEQKEREFRQKEREAAIKKKENEERVIRAREMQIAEMQRIRHIQSSAEKVEHNRTLNELKVAEKHEQENKRRMIEHKNKYRNEITTQIEQKRLAQQENQIRIENEDAKQHEQEILRQTNIKYVITAKVNAMREAKIPETVVRDVERQLKLKQTNDN